VRTGEDNIAWVARQTERSTAIKPLAVGALAVLALALRAPFAIGRLWAEDGTVFLQEAKNRGVLPPFGRAYAGYFLFVPRVIGTLAAAAPIRYAALTTWLGVAVVVGWCAATIFAESDEWLGSATTRGLLALSVVLLPALGLEAIGAAADLQYTLLFASLVALTGASAEQWRSRNRVAIVAMTALTTPLSLALAPIAVLRVLRRRTFRPDATAVAWVVATAVQLGMILIVRPSRVKSKGDTSILTHFNHRVLYANLLPKSANGTVIAPVAIIVVASLVVLAAVLAWRRARRAKAVLVLLVPLVGFAVWTFAGLRYGSPARYQVFPALCVVWSVLVAWELLVYTLRPRLRIQGRLAGIVVVLLLLSWVSYWRPTTYRRSGPTWSTALSAAERDCRDRQLPKVSVPISPIPSASKVWAVQVRCRDLVGAPPVRHWSVATPPKGGLSSVLNAMSVKRANDSWAVGSYTDAAKTSWPFAEHWNGKAWSVVLPPRHGVSSVLKAVSAVTAKDVWTVGSFTEASKTTRPLIEHWNGKAWSVVVPPRHGVSSVLKAVSAVTAKDVWAVGSYTDTSKIAWPFIEHWNGKAWSAVVPPRAGDSSVLNAVSAVTAKDVWAVGSYTDTSKIAWPFTEHWNGKAWSVIATPRAGDSSVLNAVSAVGPNGIWAVGSYTDTSKTVWPFSEHWNGKAWSLVATPRAGDGSILNAVSAVAPNDIWAVGSYTDGSKTVWPLAEHWTGTAWSVVVPPRHGVRAVLNAVATVAVNEVRAVGSYTDASNTAWPLTERYSP
jgi:hypothetical protein